MEDIARIACFTGHRPNKCGLRFMPDETAVQALYVRLDAAIEHLCGTCGITVFLCGMADGFDLFAAQRVLYLIQARRIPAAVSIVAVLPFYQEEKLRSHAYWHRAYREVLAGAREIFTIAVEYKQDCYAKRNAFLIAHAQYVVAYWNHNPRTGTGQTMRMAAQNERIIINLFDEY